MGKVTDVEFGKKNWWKEINKREKLKITKPLHKKILYKKNVHSLKNKKKLNEQKRRYTE